MRVMNGIPCNHVDDPAKLFRSRLERLPPQRVVVEQLLRLRDDQRRMSRSIHIRLQTQRERWLTVMDVPSFAADGFGCTSTPCPSVLPDEDTSSPF
jgi:hypothetical protein